jgi:MFS family permease
MDSITDKASASDEVNRRRKPWLRKTLRLSQQEAVASATMTATSDNFLNAFAVYLHASVAQMAWLTAIPQLFGALSQLASAWMGNHLHRKSLVVTAAAVQTLVVFGLAALAFQRGASSSTTWLVNLLIALAVVYFVCLNIIQPHWRAWMGGIVPQRRRGVFFAKRTRLTMVSSLAVFMVGGILLNQSAEQDLAWFGFGVLFILAATGRLLSSVLLSRMHDPEVSKPSSDAELIDSWRHVREALRDPVFRHYSFFVAAMQGAVAISAPFFAVYMLRDLNFTYLQFSLNSIASVATQFALLSFWGRFCDRFGNRAVMIVSSCIIPVVPLFWLLSPNVYYLILVQIVSGFAWSGFTLSTANYLYDIRPHHTNFAFYAAIQSATSALCVCGGALLGGLVASHAPQMWIELLSINWGSALFLVFIVTSILRISVSLYFIPRLHEPHQRKRPDMLQIIFRVARLNAISGVALDWVSVTKKNKR